MAYDDLPLVTIIIPTYKQEQMAFEAVASALAQDYGNLQILVVDDASPGCSYDAVKKLIDPRLTYIRNEHNLGRVGNYRHALTNLARGTWVITLDGDDYFTDRSFVSAAVQRASDASDVVLVAARAATRAGDAVTVPPWPGDRLYGGADVLRALPRPEFLLMHLACMYRRQLAIELNFYRSNTISSDWESLYRLAVHGTVAFMDRTVGVWRIHGSNTTRSRDWRIWADNLEIWPSIFAEGLARGMTAREAQKGCRRCLFTFGAMHLPSTLRSADKLDVFRYLRRLWELDAWALLRVLLSIGTLVRLVAGLFGYYRFRKW